MEEIAMYLALPKQERLYSVGLALFEQYGAALKPDVWKKLKVGPMGRNRQLLEEELSQLKVSGVEAAPKLDVKVIPAPALKNAQEEGDYEYELLTQKRKLLLERMQHSQSFHNCNSDEERAMVCDSIREVNKELQEVEGNLAYFKRYKKPPPAPEPKTFVLPDTDEDLAAEQQRCRSNILKVEKRIEYLLSLPENSSKRSKLPEKQDQLRELVIKVELIIQKRKKLKREQEEN